MTDNTLNEFQSVFRVKVEERLERTFLWGGGIIVPQIRDAEVHKQVMIAAVMIWSYLIAEDAFQDINRDVGKVFA